MFDCWYRHELATTLTAKPMFGRIITWESSTFQLASCISLDYQKESTIIIKRDQPSSFAKCTLGTMGVVLGFASNFTISASKIKDILSLR